MQKFVFLVCIWKHFVQFDLLKTSMLLKNIAPPVAATLFRGD